MNADDRTLLMSPLGFDLTQKNLWAPLCSGGQLVIPDVPHYDPQHLCGLIREQQITLLNCAPSAFYPLLENDVDSLQSLRQVFLGGEAINVKRLSSWLLEQ